MIILLTLMYITNNPKVALIAEKNGVDRIWIDLETLGKEERQKGMNTVKSHHTITDVCKMSSILKQSQLLVRINPWHSQSMDEINKVIEAGAQLVMLPMWKSAREVEMFIKSVAGRAKSILLLETKEAVDCLQDVLCVPGIDEIHVGLNDLHLSYDLTFMFELLTNGVVERICEQIKKTDIPYGFGGIARLGMGDIPAEQIIMEHYRLGSTRAILSRSFCQIDTLKNEREIESLFAENMKQLREFESKMSLCSSEEFSENRCILEEAVKKIVQTKRNCK